MSSNVYEPLVSQSDTTHCVRGRICSPLPRNPVSFALGGTKAAVFLSRGNALPFVHGLLLKTASGLIYEGC